MTAAPPPTFPAGPDTECRCGTTRNPTSLCPHCDAVRICDNTCRACQTIKERSAT